jgi:hypothetical protein
MDGPWFQAADAWRAEIVLDVLRHTSISARPTETIAR